MPTMPVEAGFEVTSGFAPRRGTFHGVRTSAYKAAREVNPFSQSKTAQ